MKRTRSLYSNHADVVAYNFRHNALNVFCNFLVEIDDLVVYRKFTSFDFFLLVVSFTDAVNFFNPSVDEKPDAVDWLSALVSVSTWCFLSSVSFNF